MADPVAVAVSAVPAMLPVSTGSLLTLVLIPVAAYFGKAAFESYCRFRVLKRERISSLVEVRAEIEIIIDSLTKQRDTWSGKDDQLRERVESDYRYFPYLPPVSLSSDTAYGRLRPNMLLVDGETRGSLITFYDGYGTVWATLSDMRSKEFRELDPERKLSVFSLLVQQLVSSIEAGTAALSKVERVLCTIDAMDWPT